MWEAFLNRDKGDYDDSSGIASIFPWISSKAAAGISRLIAECPEHFESITEEIAVEEDLWKKWLQKPIEIRDFPHASIICEDETNLDSATDPSLFRTSGIHFLRLLLCATVRPEWTLREIEGFIIRVLGADFIHQLALSRYDDVVEACVKNKVSVLIASDGPWDLSPALLRISGKLGVQLRRFDNISNSERMKYGTWFQEILPFSEQDFRAAVTIAIELISDSTAPELTWSNVAEALTKTVYGGHTTHHGDECVIQLYMEQVFQIFDDSEAGSIISEISDLLGPDQSMCKILGLSAHDDKLRLTLGGSEFINCLQIMKKAVPTTGSHIIEENLDSIDIMTADEILERLPGEVDIETSRKAAEAKETKKSDQLTHAQKGGKIGKLTPSHKHSEVKQKPAVEQEQQEADADDETQVKDIATETSDASEVSAEVNNEHIPEITTKEPEEKSMSPLVEFAMKEVEAYNKTINAIKEELGKEGTLHSDFMEQYAHTFQKYIKFTSPNATLTDAIDKWLVHLQNQKRHCTDMVSAKKINFIHLGQMTAAGTFIIAFQEAQAKELGLSKHPNVYLTPSKYHEKREVPPDCKDTFLEGMFIESGEWDSKKELLTSVSDSISIAPELPLMKMNICIDLKPLSFPKNVIKVPVFPLPRKSWDFGRAPSPLCYAYLPSNVSQLRMVSLRSNLFPVFFGAVIISVFVCAEALSDGKHSGDGPYKVLIVLPFASKSHKNVLWPLAMGLAGRGHLVTIITPHKPYKQVKGITEITLDGIYSSLDNAAQNMWSEDGGPYGKVKLISDVIFQFWAYRLIVIPIFIFFVGKVLFVVAPKLRCIVFAKYMDLFSPTYDSMVRSKKEEFFAELQDVKSGVQELRNKGQFRILEIGVGTGANFRYYPKNSVLIALDPNEYFLKYFDKNKREYPVHLEKFIVARGEAMRQIPTGTVDVVVTTLVLCSIKETLIKPFLAEILRVLVPGGRYYFWDHIEAPKQSRDYYLQNIVSRMLFWSYFGCGCKVNRVMDAAVETCNKTLSHYAMEPFLEGARSGTAHFDLIVVSAFFNECWYPLAKIYQAPLVLVSTSGMFPWLSHSNGFRDVTSFMTSPFFDGSKTLSFPKRLANTLAYLLSRPIEQYYYWRRIDALLLEKFEKKGYLAPSPTPLEKQLNSADLTASASMTFTNTHVSTHDVRPLLPSVVEVGGMHCAHANALPKELEEWVSGSEDGFVLFSLGSAVNPSKIPPSRRKMFIDAFSKFPRLRFLWKWDSEQMDGLPPNVKLSTWLPQQDLLGHKRIKAFITHGGLLSTQEAIYHGVPLVGLPVGADQHMNMEHVLAAGTGVTLSWSSLSAEEIISALKTVMFEPRYKERLDLKSRQFKDQPQPPVERAVYWMEYVVRHNGAEHLQSTAKNLYWFQYYLIDVWAALLVAFLISMWVSKKTATFIFGSESKSVASSKKQQKKREKSAKEKKSTKQE
ncbi:unnamed protein product [Notodromas monacha]|uniref:Uncharacterized protein n=1 Tax=Notodromas monacha TaxID=399045 RepID=A0A7R9BMX4_9CRUS|nr:unnamed protein product [Notodromas monacha]CAG0917579.1 unnamed protein product [Notodromas monacha]